MTCLKSPPAAEMNDKARENHSPALCVCYIFWFLTDEICNIVYRKMKLYCYRLKRIQQTDHCTQQTAKAVFLRSPRELRCRILQCDWIRVKYASLPHGISETENFIKSEIWEILTWDLPTICFANQLRASSRSVCVFVIRYIFQKHFL